MFPEQVIIIMSITTVHLFSDLYQYLEILFEFIDDNKVIKKMYYIKPSFCCKLKI